MQQQPQLARPMQQQPQLCNPRPALSHANTVPLQGGPVAHARPILSHASTMPTQGGVQQRGLVAPAGYPVSPAGANMCMPVAQLQRPPALAIPSIAVAVPSQPVAHTSPPARKSTLDSSLGDELTPMKEADPATAPRKPQLTLPDDALSRDIKEPESLEAVKVSPANSAGGRSPVYIRSDLHKEFAEAKLPKKFFKHISKLQGGVFPRRREFGSRESVHQPRVWQKRESTVVENIWSDSDDSDSGEEIPMGRKRSMSQPTLPVR